MEYEVASKKAGAFGVNAMVEGGAVTLGLLGAGFVGKQIENMVKKGVTKTSPMTDKLMAFVGNNAPKAALWYVTKEYLEPKTTSTNDFGKMVASDARKGMMASIAFDTLMRASNDLAPVTFPKVFGIDVMTGNQGTPNQNNGNVQQLQSNLQRMVQENSSLRGQLNQAMTKLASAPTVNVHELTPPQSHDTRFGMMQTTPEAENRRRNFGAMTPPIEAERNRRYGAMDKKALNFAGEDESVSAMYGML